MGAVLGKVALVAAGAVLGGAAVQAAHRAACAAVEAVFDAIAETAEVVASNVSAIYRAVASAIAEAYEEVKHVVVEACDAVKRAAACVSSRVVEIIECLHGMAAAAWAKTKLAGVNFLVQAGDVSSTVAAIVNGINRLSSPVFPNRSPSQFFQPESAKARRAASNSDKITELLGLIASAVAVGKTFGFEIPKAAVSVIVIVAKLIFSILFA